MSQLQLNLIHWLRYTQLKKLKESGASTEQINRFIESDRHEKRKREAVKKVRKSQSIR